MVEKGVTYIDSTFIEQSVTDEGIQYKVVQSEQVRCIFEIISGPSNYIALTNLTQHIYTTIASFPAK